MFGIRSDGRALKNVDPIIKMTPLIMVDRNDAQVFSQQDIDWAATSDYIRRKREEGYKISHMSIVIAAFVRAIAYHPELNRFVVNKRIYARKDLSVSFAVLKKRTAEEVIETTVKLHFNPDDTIYTVSDKVNQVIEIESEETAESVTDKVASAVLAIPGIPHVAVGLLKGLDAIGLLPKAILEASPFHTSMFITNMASIKMGKVYHHIYNFGTTSIFTSMGKKEERVYSVDGVVSTKPVFPMGVVIDERIAPGATYAMAFHRWQTYMKKPELLEVPPEAVRWDDGVTYHND